MHSNDLMAQLESERRKVDFDTYDFTVKELISLIDEGIVDIAPTYQRKFVWPDANQSSLIESVLLGVPVPSLFMAANADGTWEVIDGVQRLSTMVRFAGHEGALEKLGISSRLKLSGLQKLSSLNGLTFQDLPQNVQLKFLMSGLKVTTLSDKSDLQVRFDLFERLNTGGVTLSPQEVRACVFDGKFNDFINELAEENDDFRSVIRLQKSQQYNGTYQELVLRFFAYYYDRESFDHSVIGFLNDYMEKNSTFSRTQKQQFRELFENTFNSLKSELGGDIISRGSAKVTSLILYEAIAIGSAEVIASGGSISSDGLQDLMKDEELKKLTTGATNSKSKLRDRINYVVQYFTDA